MFTHTHTHTHTHPPTHPPTHTHIHTQQNKSSGRVNRANQRKLASLFSAGDISSDLAKYNQLKVQYLEMLGAFNALVIKFNVGTVL